jgi:predicted metal-dependent peptidase
VGGVKDRKQAEITLAGVFCGIVGDDMDNKKDPDVSVEKRDLVSILTVFKGANVPKMVDCLSMDVEGAESLVMADFPWQAYTSRILTIKRPKDDRKAALRANRY